MKKIFILFMLAASPCWGAYAYVQSKACHTTSGTSNACQYGSSVVTTDLLVVACIASRLTACLSVTDDQGDTFTLVGGTTTTAAPSGATNVWGIWYATAAAASQTAVTCNDACGNTTWIEQSIHEYSGNMYLTDPFDVSSSSSSSVSISTTTATAPPVTPSKDSELIFALAPTLPSAATAGNGTIRTNSVDNSFWATEDFFQGTSAIYQSSFTFTQAAYVNRMSQASFKPPTPAPTGVETWQ